MNNFDLLKEWVIQNGGYVHPAIYRKKNENGIYGLFTNQDLNPNEVLIKVSESIFINENTNNINFNDNYNTNIIFPMVARPPIL